MGTVLVGLEKLSYLINHCAAYEQLYLNTQYETIQNLEDALTELYLAILKFLVAARKMCSKNTAGGTTVHYPTAKSRSNQTLLTEDLVKQCGT
jgi:hypothetical protein